MDKERALKILEDIAQYCREAESAEWNPDINAAEEFIKNHIVEFIPGKDGKNRCPNCGRILEKREIAIFDGMLKSLWNVFKWCLEKEKHEFDRKEIEEFLVGGNQKARFGDWVLFGGLVYRPEVKPGKIKKGHFGLNIERCDQFFKNKLSIPSRLWKDPITDEIDKVDYRFAREIPGLIELLDEDGFYKARYATAGQLSL